MLARHDEQEMPWSVKSIFVTDFKSLGWTHSSWELENFASKRQTLVQLRSSLDPQSYDLNDARGIVLACFI